MFYSHFSLSKKGPLARIWLAAHWDKKLTKAQVFETNIETSVDGILQPKVKMALRTSGHLLLGVVRIYSRKAKYLLADCNEAFVKIKMAFRPGMVDLPEDNHIAAANAITLPEVFHDFDTAMPDLNDVDIEAQFSLNQSRAEEITLHEDYNISSMVSKGTGFDQGFGFSEVENSDILRHGIEHSLLFSEGVDHLMNREKEPIASTSSGSGILSQNSLGIDAPIRDDGFGGNLGQVITDNFFQAGGLFDDVPAAPMEVNDGPPSPPPFNTPLRNDDDDDHFMPPSPSRQSSDGSRPASPVNLPFPNAGALGLIPSPERDQTLMPPPDLDMHDIHQPEEPEQLSDQNATVDQTTLVQNEEESFALAPVDASALRGLPKTKRKRKLIVDEVKNISGEEMKAQLSDTTDIVITLDLAPPTKRLMHWKETGGVEKLFALPGKNIPAIPLAKNYQRHLTAKTLTNEELDTEGGVEGDEENVLPAITGPVPARRGRKRKVPLDDDVQKPAKKDPLPPIPELPHNLDSMDVEIAVSSTIAPPPTSDVPEESVDLEHQNQQALGSPLNNSTHMLPPGTPIHKSNESQNVGMTNEEQRIKSFDEIQEQPPSVHDTSNQPELQNMGYENNINQSADFNQVIMDNMGYDGHHNAPITPGLPSPRGGATPWRDQDYDYPSSVGPPEEQQAPHETNEQFEERVMNKRANQLYHTIKMRFTQKESLVFDDLTYKNRRKEAAQKFYSVLVLKKYKVLELIQAAPYEPIQLVKGACFTDPKL
ncbi:double-strand-break repair protein rad21 homolog [Adelges cooleyi]|uniref:double-strand-break repair protein rad21 homolog n=1 Tax=Adelges cooleyi TaxID=133065 RepID=UPI00217F253B|nr:double-strand-break repair protein rad21 homolog [Adelges cooleyi]XP_050430302.1 double-strand-break repair protein rad21 homolog [Adelges cooleyi]